MARNIVEELGASMASAACSCSAPSRPCASGSTRQAAGYGLTMERRGRAIEQQNVQIAPGASAIRRPCRASA
jgi:hypothetical protein